MKKNIKYITLLCLLVCIIVLSLTACNPQDIKGTYYSTSDTSQYIKVKDVTTSSATVDVNNVTLKNYNIYNYTCTDISIEIYKTDSNDKELKYFRSNINGIEVQGTFHIGTYTIKIGEQVFQK